MAKATEESLTRAVLESVAYPLHLKEMGRAARRNFESRAFADASAATWEMYGTTWRGEGRTGLTGQEI